MARRIRKLSKVLAKTTSKQVQQTSYTTMSVILLFIAATFSVWHFSQAGGFLSSLSNVATIGACKVLNRCCNDISIPGDIQKLRANLDRQVFGQHIATEMVVNAIAGHWNSPHARKPLAMSFHGWTGSGKNYISQIIAESLYADGMKSQYVHLFNAGIDFPELTNVAQYKQELYRKIAKAVAECPKQLFIFDDVHAMPPGVLDAIRVIIDYHENVDNVDYRQCIFIFLSNTGALSIRQHFLDMWRSGRRREDIRLSDFETMISQGAFNEEGTRFDQLPIIGSLIKWYNYIVAGGFFRSETIKKNLIDHYIPFLPMERQHIRLCTILEFQIRGIPILDDDVAQEVMSFVEWGPPPENMFAKTGCKRLSQKVAAIAMKLLRKQSDDTRLEL